VLDSVNEITTVGSAPFKVRADAPAAAPKADSDEKESSSGAASPASGVASPTSSSSSSSAVVWGAFADKREQEAFLQHWRALGDQLRAQRLQAALSSSASSSASSVHVRNGGGTMCVGESIEFQDCAIVSPDGRLLVEHLNVQIPAGTNVMVTGPNGCGKSSLFRVLGELWPLHSGHLIKPTKEDIMFVPQKPYQVIGTLRDQLIYPHSIDQMKALGVTDEDLSKLLRVSLCFLFFQDRAPSLSVLRNGCTL
jgi:ABC-type multidrug transport system fused ATPase/permease subunit